MIFSFLDNFVCPFQPFCLLHLYLNMRFSAIVSLYIYINLFPLQGPSVDCLNAITEVGEVSSVTSQLEEGLPDDASIDSSIDETTDDIRIVVD